MVGSETGRSICPPGAVPSVGRDKQVGECVICQMMCYEDDAGAEAGEWGAGQGQGQGVEPGENNGLQWENRA